MSSGVQLRDRAATAIQLGESHFREFKSALAGVPGEKVNRDIKEICADIAQTLVAFANADGGELIVGVEDNGVVSGVESFKERDLAVMEEASKSRVHAETPLESVRCARLEISGHVVLYFSVKKGIDLIHLTSDGKCLQRRDMSSLPISTERISFDRNERISRAYDRSFEEGPQANALDLNLVKAVAEQISKGMSAEKCLQYLDLAEYADGGLKLRRAALLLFAKEPNRWHPRLQIRVIKVNGNEVKTGADYNVVADELVSGNVVHLIENGWDALRPHLVQTTLGAQARFESKVMYPEYACREALVNAIAHRDYSQEGRGIEIYIFQDRMEVVNPGALLSTISVEDLKKLDGVHQSRNSLIARVLRELGYMRELGEGLRRIFSLMTANELAPPDIKSSRDTFSIALHHKPIYSREDLFWLEQFSRFEFDREKKSLILLGKHGNIFSPKDIWDALGIVDTEHYRKVVDYLQRIGVLINEITPDEAKKLARKKRIPTRQFPRFKIRSPSTEPLEANGVRPAFGDSQTLPLFDERPPRRRRRTREALTPLGASTSLATSPQQGAPHETPVDVRAERRSIPLATPPPGERRDAAATPTPPSAAVKASTTRLYVGNLSIDCSVEELVQRFEGFGEVVDVDLPMNGEVGKGYAVVEMASQEQAHRAISGLHNSEIRGRALKIREDRR